MKKYLSLLLFFFSISAFSSAIDKNEFYAILASNNVLELEKCLQNLEAQKPSSKNNAYKAVALMKRANFIKDSKERLSYFSKGAKLLDAEINKNPANLEYRFLRLVVQERAPKFLKYNQYIQVDKKEIIKGYNNMDAFLQQKVTEFAKKSKVLTLSELQ